MGHFKNLHIEIIELYESGLSCDLIADGLSMDYAEVRQVIREYVDYILLTDCEEYND